MILSEFYISHTTEEFQVHLSAMLILRRKNSRTTTRLPLHIQNRLLYLY